MSQEKLDDILKRGMYGSKETLPEERNFFLGTINERVYLALTNNQVRKRGMYEEVQDLLKRKEDEDMEILINGELNYSYYSNYVQEATKNSVPFRIVNNDSETPIGIIVASKQPVTKQENIFIKDDEFLIDFPND